MNPAPAIALTIALTLTQVGCGSSGGGQHRAYRGPAHLEANTMQWLDQGTKCEPLPRPFNPGSDTITVEVRPGIAFRDFWYGVDEWGRDVGGYLQLLQPWPFIVNAPRYDLKMVLYCDPSTDPLTPTEGVGYHEAGGHGNLVPSGIFDHAGKFRKCYPWWRLSVGPLAQEDYVQEPVGRHLVVGPDGQVLHECFNDDVQASPAP